jgi:glycosyltransferase involved in cell wall biosynthesis
MDKIIYNVASHKRPDTLIKTIESIYNQSDIINVFLNDYSEIPVELYDKKINLFITDNDKGDAYKFYNLPNSNGYFFTIDDDLIYPKNYTDYMVSKIEKYGRKKIISLHGRSFVNKPIKSYYKDKVVLSHFLDSQNNDVEVEFGGTGVMSFHTDLFKLDITYFKYANMADIWIGKYAYENNIKITSVSRSKNFITQQKIEGSIFDDYNKKDKLQTKVVNEFLDKPKVSIIIPTFKNVNYIDECIDSVIKSCKNISYEILIGIDNCSDTLSYIKNKEYNQFIKFYYFRKNVGPYIIKNTLADLSTTDENLIFFDSDDIMKENMVMDILKDLKVYECVKPMYHNFEGFLDKNLIKYSRNSGLWGEGVFGIKKDTFLKQNGFEPWLCAADSDFLNRLNKNKIKINQTKSTMFYRRIHSFGLTSRQDTGYKSELRKKYVQIMKNKTSFGPLPILNVEKCEDINTKVIYDYSNRHDENIKTSNDDTNRKKMDVLNLMNTISHELKPKVGVDYQKINELINRQNIFKPKEHVKESIKPKPKIEVIEFDKDSINKLKKEMFKEKPKRKGTNPNIFGNNQRRKGGFTI